MSDHAGKTEDVQAAPTEAEKRRGFPSPYSILILVTILVWVAVLFIPLGQYRLDQDGNSIAGSFQQIESPLDFDDRVAWSR
jgi:uncharacterized ion transporter superfamily protein YfcC